MRRRLRRAEVRRAIRNTSAWRQIRFVAAALGITLALAVPGAGAFAQGRAPGAAEQDPVTAAEAALDAAIGALTATHDRITAAETRLAEVERERTRLEAALTAGRRREADLGAELVDIEEALRSAVVGAFMGNAEDADRMIAGADTDAAARSARRAELVAAGTDVLLGQRDALQEEISEAGRAVQDLIRRLVAGRVEAETLSAGLAHDRAEGDRLATEVIELADAFRMAKLGIDVRTTTLPLPASDAYLRAATILATEDPACGIGWWHLAAVGQVESNHGSTGGRPLLPDGRPERPIIGVPLDGRTILAGGEGVASISDTDGGALDGDPVHDRAVGPMQFIPSTWQRWQADGDGNGVADPQDIDDAALAAARYLCHGDRDLRLEDDLRQAFLSYNRSQRYADRVIALANAYRPSGS